MTLALVDHLADERSLSAWRVYHFSICASANLMYAYKVNFDRQKMPLTPLGGSSFISADRAISALLL